MTLNNLALYGLILLLVFLVLNDDKDEDDDGPGGGILQPAYAANQK